MVLPTFEAFLEDIGSDGIEKWVEAANLNGINIHLPITAFNVGTLMQTIATMSLSMSKAMLSDYHEWLLTQLAQRSVRLIKQ